MTRRKSMGTPLAFVAVIAAALSVGSCSSGSGGGGSGLSSVGLAQGCTLNSDCDAPLVCVFGLCHEACAATRDCPTGEVCVSAGSDRICTLPTEACADGGACPTGLVCGSDKGCHDPCATGKDCLVPGQTCSAGACIDPPEGGGVIEAGAEGGGGGRDSGGSDSASGHDGGGSDAPADAPFTSTDAGPLGFVASNLPPSAVVPAPSDAGDGGAPVAVITASCSNCLPATAVTITQNDGSPADLYVLQSLEIDTTAGLALTGPNPIVIAVLGTADIRGTISVTTAAESAVAGGFSSGSVPGPGGGQAAVGTYANSGGGGGSYCGIGGTAVAYGGDAQAQGGVAYGNATITPLLGGSAGGAAGGEVDTAGGGGGAVQLVAGQSIVVGAEGAITAGGGGGSYDYASGGGSGGAILLEAPTVTIQGVLAANGGSGGPGGTSGTANAQPAPGGGSPLLGGAGSAGTGIDGGNAVVGTPAQPGGGGGGAGRIRINTASGAATLGGILSPDATTACVTQGKIGG